MWNSMRPGQQQRAVVHLRAARDDLDVEAASRVGAVRHGLVEAAMFGLGQPVGAEGDGINAFVTDRAHMAGYMAARDRWCAGMARLPASTLVIVSGFTRPEFKVEIEVAAARLPTP
jgi:hypothetical protein